MSEYFDHFRVLVNEGHRQWEKKIRSHDFYLGRMKPCELILDASYISRKHARVFVDKGCLWIEDLNSSNGVCVNGLKIPSSTPTEIDGSSVISFGENHKISLVLEVVTVIDSSRSSDLKEQASRALNHFSSAMKEGAYLLKLKIERKEKLIDQVKRESKLVIQTTREERAQMLTQSKREAEEILQEAKTQAARLVEEAEKDSASQRSDLEKDLKNHQEKMESYQQTLETLQNQIRTNEEELKNIQLLLKEKKEEKMQSEETLNGLQVQIEDLEKKRHRISNENEDLEEENQELKALIAERSQLETQVQKLQEEQAHLRAFVDELIEERKELRERLTEEKDQAKKEAHRMVSEAEQKAAEIRARSQEKADLQLKEIDEEVTLKRSEAEAFQREKRAEAQQELEKATSEVAKIKEDIEREQAQAIAKMEKELLELRAKKLQEIEQAQKEAREKYDQFLRGEAQAIQQKLIEEVSTRLKPYLTSKALEEESARVDQILKRATDSVILGVDFDEEDLERHLKARPLEQQRKNRRFFMKASALGMGVLVLAAFLPTLFKGVEQSARDLASTKAKQEKETIREMEEKREELARFEPEQTDKYHDSYTERVLYTKNYVKTELDPHFREQWILALSEHLFKTLRLNEDVVVIFIAQEANLIRDLQAAREEINGQFVEPGIERMKDIEKKFLKTVTPLAGSRKKLRKIFKYKKKFYLENRRQE